MSQREILVGTHTHALKRPEGVKASLVGVYLSMRMSRACLPCYVVPLLVVWKELQEKLFLLVVPAAFRVVFLHGHLGSDQGWGLPLVLTQSLQCTEYAKQCSPGCTQAVLCVGMGPLLCPPMSPGWQSSTACTHEAVRVPRKTILSSAHRAAPHWGWGSSLVTRPG